LTLRLSIERQPDDRSCGATCLHALYRFLGETTSLDRLNEEIAQLPTGGTLGVHLANHALERGYEVDIYTYNLAVFDPSWFDGDHDIAERLEKQRALKSDPKLQEATDAYLRCLAAGGRIHHVELSAGLLRASLDRGLPLLVGLSATYLYGTKREHPETEASDDLRREPAGHFVLLCGYEPEGRRVSIADPYFPNALSRDHTYQVSIERALGAILLGVLTYDANLIVIGGRRQEAG